MEGSSKTNHRSNHRLLCNLCRRAYRSSSPYKRFCSSCRLRDVYRFGDWLGAGARLSQRRG